MTFFYFRFKYKIKMEESNDLINVIDDNSTKEKSTKEKSTKEKSTKEKSTKVKSTKEKSTKEKSTKEKSTKIEKLEENIDNYVKDSEQNEDLENVEDLLEELEQKKLIDEIFPEDVSDESGDSNDNEEKENLNMQLDLIIETLLLVTDTNLKEITLTKEFVTQLSKKVKDINKLSSKLFTNTLDIYTKENLVSIKNKNSKQKKPKKVVNKENMAINKGQETFPEVLQFMEFEEDSLVSRAQLIQKINSFVRIEKEKKNPDIFVEGDNKLFKLIGPLKHLFEFIRIKMIEREDFVESDEFPMQISYRDIMKYLKYCFHPTLKK